MNKVFVILVVMSMWACGNTPLYHNALNFETKQWSYQDTIAIDFEITDTEQQYDLELAVDHTTEYFYQNIYITIQTQFPDGTTKDKVLPIDLATKTGKWNGDCNSKNCELKIVLLNQFKFRDGGKYKISISQNSREKELEGIGGVTLGLYKSQD